MEEQYVQVQNLTGQTVAYRINEDNLRRAFGPYETKQIAYTELKKLYYQPGGPNLIQNFLRIEDKNIALEFGVSEDSFEHEYSWTRDKIDQILTQGSLDELHDALDFAPEGIVDTIIDRALILRINDVNKRQLIQQCTGKNIDKMIETQMQLEELLGEPEDTRPKHRRVNNNNTTQESAGRRVG